MKRWRRHTAFDHLMQEPGDRAGVLDFGLGVEPHGPWRLFNRTLDLRRAGMNDHVCDCA